MCMFTSVRLKNFKCYKDSGVIPLAPLTVLIGRNNAGKSTILQALLALSQTVRDGSSSARLVTKGEFVDLGSFYDVLHGDSRSSNRRIAIEVSRDPHLIHTPPGFKFRESTRLRLSLSFKKRANRIEVANLELADADSTVFQCSESNWNAPGVSSQVKKYLDVGLRNFLPMASANVAPKGRVGKKSQEAAIDAHISIDTQRHLWFRLFSGLRRVPPHRSHVPFFGSLGESSEAGSGQALLRDLSGMEQTDGKTMLDTTSDWLRRFGVISNLRIKRIDDEGRVISLVADDRSGDLRGVNVAAMGEGVSQILPIIYEVVRARQHGCLVIEQPEVHVHPGLQADLADLLIEVVCKGKRQILVETHSEHLLLRLRTHVAKGTISADKVAILFVEKDGDVATARKLNLKENGHLTDWPKGFFSEGYQESLALSLASQKRASDG